MLVKGSNQNVLIVVSPSINYFYSVIGNRIAEALRNLGFNVTVSTLQTATEQAIDWLFLVNISEITIGHGNLETAMKRISSLRAHSRHSAVIVLDCVHTDWFADNYRLCREAKIDLLIDLGFHSQYQTTPKRMRDTYCFLFSGLTQSEQLLVQQYRHSTVARPVPWAFIGHLESNRARLVQRIVTSGLEPNGIVYLPRLMAYSSDGPHLNGQQLRSILERTRYYIWCSHHNYFYIESERFRDALMAGAVPIKVMDSPPDVGQRLPFADLMLSETSFVEQICSFNFAVLRDSFIKEYCELPSLEQSLSDLIEQRG